MIPQEGTKEFKEWLFNLTKSQKPHRHKYYDQTVEHHEHMEIHVDGEKPEKLLNINRPNESQEIKDYRLEVYKPVTKSLCDKVVNTVNKIFNPRLYRIEFQDKPTQIKDGEGLETYLTEDYPYYMSLMNYIQETAIRELFVDPNGVIVIWPEYMDVPETEYFKPCPVYKESEYVVEFKDDEYFVFIDDEEPKIVTIIDAMYKSVYEVTQDGSGKADYEEIYKYEHGLGTPPCFRIGGMIKGKYKPYYFESYISGVLPHWDKVITMTSDLDGSIVNNLYPEFYEWQVECDAGCQNGYHKRVIDYGPDKGQEEKIKCNKCEGTGKITARGPFGALTINRDALNPDSPIPTPPKDYITKDIEPIRELKTIIKEEEQKGFSAINMEILNKVGENQSGIAKTIDRQDLDSFLDRISKHIFKYTIPNIIWYTAAWRYKNVLEDITEYLPKIHPSKDYSVLSINELMEEYKQASQTNVSPFYLRRLEEEIVNSKFSNDEKTRLKNLAVIRLNPFPNKNSDDLLTALSQGTIKKEDWIKANYIEELVARAVIENEEFLAMDLIEQNTILDNLISKYYTTKMPVLIDTTGNS